MIVLEQDRHSCLQQEQISQVTLIEVQEAECDLEGEVVVVRSQGKPSAGSCQRHHQVQSIASILTLLHIWLVWLLPSKKIHLGPYLLVAWE